jgi:autotransporter-associated beta strand protein
MRHLARTGKRSMSKAILRRATAALNVSGLVIALPAAVAAPPRYDHVVVVVEENHAESQIIGDTTDAPYINSLFAPANGGVSFSNFFALNHPSQPNYLQMFSGSTQGVTTDTPPTTVFTTVNLAASLRNAGVSFPGYSETLPSVGFTGTTDSTGLYVRKHNPWVDWQATSPTGNELPASMNQPFTAFPTNFASLPPVSFVVPNLQDDMHNGTINMADVWLQNHIGAYNTWAKANNSLLIVTWDEDDNGPNNNIPTIFSGANLITGVNATTYNHNNLLRTIEDMYGAVPSGAAANVGDITGVFAAANSATLSWDPAQNHSLSGGAGTWDAATTSDWFNGVNDVTWASANTSTTAVFAGSPGIVTVGTVNASNINFQVAGYTLSGGTLTMSGGAKISAVAGSTTINSVLAGTSGLNITSGGVTLGGANTFTGGLNISGGAFVKFATDSNLGAAGQPVTVAGATISYTGTTVPTISRAVTIGAGGATINTVNSAGAGKLVINGVISGAGSVTKNGAGWLTLYGANTTTGSWTVSAGLIEAGNKTAIGSGAVTVNSGAELSNNAPAAIANNVTLNGGSTISADYSTAGSTGTYSGNISAAGSFNVRLGNFWSTASQNVAFTGGLSGAGSLTTINASGAASSTGILTLAGNGAAYTGSINIQTGAVATSSGASKPLGTGVITLSGGTLALKGQVGPGGAANAPAAVGVSGFTNDIIFGATDTGGTVTTGLDNAYSYYQNGYNPAGTALSGGLTGTSITGLAATPFSLQPFIANNALRIAEGSNGTLTVNSPTTYTKLSVLAASAFAQDDTPNLTIKFTDGTSVTTTYKAYDWSEGTDAARTSASVFGSTGVFRYSATQTPNQDTRAFGMYQTDIDLTSIGGVDYSFRPVQSLTFNATGSDTKARGETAIFAVSGASRQSAATSALGIYGNNVTVSANSTIDLAGREAIMGALTIGANTLTVKSDDTSTQPYVLSFTSTTTTGTPTYTILPSAGGGAGTVVVNSGTGQVAPGALGLAGVQRFSALSVTSGTVRIQPHDESSPSVVVTSGLNLSGSGAVDLTNNDLLVNYSGRSPAGAIAALLREGSRGGGGLESSAADATHALGYADAAALGAASFDGQSITAGAVLVKYTTLGDSTLDGTVDAGDVSDFLQGFAAGGSTWTQGDYNYDGVVDSSDFALLRAGYTASGAAPGAMEDDITSSPLLSISQKAQLLSAVPEPGMASAGLIAIAGIAIRRRKPARASGT